MYLKGTSSHTHGYLVTTFFGKFSQDITLTRTNIVLTPPFLAFLVSVKRLRYNIAF